MRGRGRREGREGSKGQSKKRERDRVEWGGGQWPLDKEEGLYMDLCTCVPPVMPLLMGPVYLLSQVGF